MRGSQTELLDTFLKLGFLSPEALKALKARGAGKGIPVMEAAIVSGILHADAKGWVLANTLGIPFLEVDPDAVPLSFSEILPETVAQLRALLGRHGGSCAVSVRAVIPERSETAFGSNPTC